MMLLGNSTVQCISHTAEHKNGRKKIYHTKDKSDGSCANLRLEKKIIQKSEAGKFTGKGRKMNNKCRTWTKCKEATERINAFLVMGERNREEFVKGEGKGVRRQSAGMGGSNNKCNTGGFRNISLMSARDYTKRKMVKQNNSVLTPTAAKTSTFL